MEKEIKIAETEMPGLMAIREEYKGRNHSRVKMLGCLHMTIQTAVLIETLVDLGASVRWSSCNVSQLRIMQRCNTASQNIPVYAWKGETEEDTVGVSNKLLRVIKIGNQICY